MMLVTFVFIPSIYTREKRLAGDELESLEDVLRNQGINIGGKHHYRTPKHPYIRLLITLSESQNGFRWPDGRIAA
jgi:hypothetical protein